jgi:hypothetical protein
LRQNIRDKMVELTRQGIKFIAENFNMQKEQNLNIQEEFKSEIFTL